MTVAVPITELAWRRSVTVRRERMNFRRDLAGARVSIVDVLPDPPEFMWSVRLDELLLWQPFFGARRLEVVGRHAVRDGVNLLVPLGRASVRSRLWLVRELER